MRVVLQRVKRASVTIDGSIHSQIGGGMLVLLGISPLDNSSDIEWLCAKISKLRIFDDPQGVMNLSVMDVGGEVLVVSQFTLMASTSHGNRPSYIGAARPEIAIPLYEEFVSSLEKTLGKKVATGVFGADMKVELLNDGPVTILLDSQKRE